MEVVVLANQIPVAAEVSMERVTLVPILPCSTAITKMAEPFLSLVMMFTFSNPIVASTKK